MTAERFDEILIKRLNQSRTMLASKSGEYAKGGDRLHNFNRAAVIRGTTADDALYGMMLKHLVSVLDMLDDSIERGLIPGQAMIDEKFGDLHNYLILLEAIYCDMREKNI